MQQHQPAPIGASSNILSLAEARSSRRNLICGRTVETQNCISSDDKKTAHARLLQFPNRAHVHDSEAQRVANKTRARAERVSDDEWRRALGARLRAYRIQRGVSEEDAAEVAGRSVETWLNYERSGRGHLTFPILRFCKRYGISLDDIITD